jgi:hypothetical protein
MAASAPVVTDAALFECRCECLVAGAVEHAFDDRPFGAASHDVGTAPLAQQEA